MCGRYFNHAPAMHSWTDILELWPGEHELGYNISPTSTAPIVSQGGVCGARWGMVPPWAKEFGGKYPTHNARIETFEEKPSYRGAWKNFQTCLVPMGGYYEWVKEEDGKQPYVIHSPGDILVVAGLWEAWNDKLSFTIITTESSGLLSDIHGRMPVILTKEKAVQWLNEPSMTLLQHPLAEAHVEYFKVSRDVNRSAANGPDLITRID